MFSIFLVYTISIKEGIMSEQRQQLVNQALESWEIFSTSGDIEDAKEMINDLNALEKYDEEERENE
jgi:hypothetical protein